MIPGNFKSLRQGFHWLAIFMFTAMAFVIIQIALLSSQVRAQDPGVIVSPQIDIFVGPEDQGKWGLKDAAFDSINNRFLVVWTNSIADVTFDVYGQLVNADGKLHGSRIAIPTPDEKRDPQVAFDPVNRRFLVTWIDSRDYPHSIYGQLVNDDGNLYGSNFAISPAPSEGVRHAVRNYTVQFDTQNHRYLIVWSGQDLVVGVSNNVFGQFINSVGIRDGVKFQISNYGEGGGAYLSSAVFDENNSRFLVTWFYDNHGYGRLINSDGSLYGSEIAICSVSSSSYSSLSFDPINGRFLQAIWRDFFIRGQLIDAEGNLFGNEFQISPPENAPDTNPYFSVVFDTVKNKFLVVGSTSLDNEYISHGIYGQLLNPDGSLSGSYFRILDTGENVSHTGSYSGLHATLGSAATGSLVIYGDCPNLQTAGYDFFGQFVKLASRTDLTPILNLLLLSPD